MKTLLLTATASLWTGAAGVQFIAPPTEENAIAFISVVFSYWHECKEDAKDKTDPMTQAQAAAVNLYATAAGIDMSDKRTNARIQVQILINKQLINVMGGSSAWCRWMDDMLKGIADDYARTK